MCQSSELQRIAEERLRNIKRMQDYYLRRRFRDAIQRALDQDRARELAQRNKKGLASWRDRYHNCLGATHG